MAYYYSRKIKIPFEEAVQKITRNLQEQGFGIITHIDLTETLKQKLDLDFRKYKILGACNPEFAYKAVSLESHIGLMLPCNVVIQEHENNEVEISAISPLQTIDKATHNYWHIALIAWLSNLYIWNCRNRGKQKSFSISTSL